MKKNNLPFGLLILLVLIGTTLLAQQPKDPCCENKEYIEVRATAEKRVQPDVAYLGVNIREHNEKKERIKLAVTEAKLLNILDQVGIGRANLKVDGLSSFQQRLRKKKFQTMQSKNYTLKLTDFTKIDDFMDRLDEVEHVSIYLKKLDKTDIDKHKLDAYAESMKMAKRKAVAMLSAVGQSAGKVIYAMDDPTVHYPMYNRQLANVYMAEDAAMPAPVDNDVAVDDIIIRQRVTVRFAIN